MIRKVMGGYNEELGRFSAASLITGSTNDITQVQMLAGGDGLTDHHQDVGEKTNLMVDK